MTTHQTVAASAPSAFEYEQDAPDPPSHGHVGPWAVFQAFDPERYTLVDRERAAQIMRPLVLAGPVPRAEVIAYGRRALSHVLSARLLGHVPNDHALYRRVVREAPTSSEAETLRGRDLAPLDSLHPTRCP